VKQPTLLPDEWNVPADYLPSGRGNSNRRRPISLDPAKLLEQARARHPDAKFVHWLGGLKPWTIQPNEDPQ
jgi:hypothetical protein